MTIGILGYGAIGAALATGLHERRPDIGIAILEKRPSRRRWAVEKLNAVDCGVDPEALCRASDVVVLAVRLSDLETYSGTFCTCLGDKPVISLVPDATIDTVCGILCVQNVCRFVLNLAAQVSEAVVAIAYPPEPSDNLLRAANAVAGAVGTPWTVQEDQLPAIAGLTASGTAYLLKFVHGLCLGAVESGMRYEEVLDSVSRILRGTATLLEEGDEQPIELMTKIVRPGSPAIAGVRVLDDRAFEGAVSAAVTAAARAARAAER